MGYFGKTLIILGTIFIVVGVFLVLGGRIPWLGRLPGDIIIQKKNFSFYFPITSCIIISIILSIVFYLFFRQK